jgi:hypothetical protein
VTSTRGAVDFVIVGAQKAGSSHLGACLMDHPQVFLCPDEVPYFEDPFYLNSPPSALEHVFVRAEPGHRRGIHRPEYLARPECAPRIRTAAPDARIFAVLRDPTDRAISAYFWYLQFGLVPFEPPEVGLARLFAGWSNPKYPRAREVVEYGFYAGQIRQYLDLFGRDQVLVLLADELSDVHALARAYRFLGIDDGHVSKALGGRSNKGVYDLRRLRLLRARRRLAFSWDEVREYTYKPRRLRKPLSFLPNAAIVGFDRLLLARLLGNEKPSMSEELVRDIRSEYAQDIHELAELLGQDLSAWLDPSPAEGSGMVVRAREANYDSGHSRSKEPEPARGGRQRGLRFGSWSRSRSRP